MSKKKLIKVVFTVTQADCLAHKIVLSAETEHVSGMFDGTLLEAFGFSSQKLRVGDQIEVAIRKLPKKLPNKTGSR